jgi:hypothetical protein
MGDVVRSWIFQTFMLHNSVFESPLDKVMMMMAKYIIL